MEQSNKGISSPFLTKYYSDTNKRCHQFICEDIQVTGENQVKTTKPVCK